MRARRQALNDGVIAWEQREIDVDGAATPFEILHEGGQWLALGRVETVDVEVHSDGVALGDARLVRVTNPAAYV